MDEEKAATLCKELREIVDRGPGKTNAYALKRVRSILAEFQRLGSDDVNAKVNGVSNDFETWFSARRWNSGGDSGSFIKGRLHAYITEFDSCAQAWLERDRH